MSHAVVMYWSDHGYLKLSAHCLVSYVFAGLRALTMKLKAKIECRNLTGLLLRPRITNPDRPDLQIFALPATHITEWSQSKSLHPIQAVNNAPIAKPHITQTTEALNHSTIIQATENRPIWNNDCINAAALRARAPLNIPTSIRYPTEAIANTPAEPVYQRPIM